MAIHPVGAGVGEGGERHAAQVSGECGGGEGLEGETKKGPDETGPFDIAIAGLPAEVQF